MLRGTTWLTSFHRDVWGLNFTLKIWLNKASSRQRFGPGPEGAGQNPTPADRFSLVKHQAPALPNDTLE